MVISVASGKGGTGKTTVAVNLALSIPHVQFLDCDVEEPNAHIFLKPDIRLKQPACIPVPRVDETLCDHCGACREACAYNAVAVLPPAGEKKGTVLVFPHLCHGCGACSLLCPRKAIREVERPMGVVESGKRADMLFVHGCLAVGEAMSPPLIRQVKERIDASRTVIIDAPPGTSCPVITAIKGSDFCLLVTEPTPFGRNDLVLAVEVVRALGIPMGVVLNRSDIGDGSIQEYCRSEHIPVLMSIPFSREIARSYSEGIPLVEQDSSYRQAFAGLFRDICAVAKAGR